MKTPQCLFLDSICVLCQAAVRQREGSPTETPAGRRHSVHGCRLKWHWEITQAITEFIYETRSPTAQTGFVPLMRAPLINGLASLPHAPQSDCHAVAIWKDARQSRHRSLKYNFFATSTDTQSNCTAEPDQSLIVALTEVFISKPKAQTHKQ